MTPEISITCIERIILESIQRNHQTVTEIMQDTSLNLYTLNIGLEHLISKGLVQIRNKTYILGKRSSLPQENNLSSTHHLQHELLEFMHHSFELERNTFFHKFYLSSKDRPVFKALLKNLDNFIRQLPPPPSHVPTHEQEIFFWGTDQYGKSIHQLLKG